MSRRITEGDSLGGQRRACGIGESYSRFNKLFAVLRLTPKVRMISETLAPWRRILLASNERRSALRFRAIAAFSELALGLTLARALARAALLFGTGTFLPSATEIQEGSQFRLESWARTGFARL